MPELQGEVERRTAEAFDSAEARRLDAVALFQRDEDVERLAATLAKQEAEEIEALDATVATSDWVGAENERLTAENEALSRMGADLNDGCVALEAALAAERAHADRLAGLLGLILRTTALCVVCDSQREHEHDPDCALDAALSDHKTRRTP